MMRFGIPQYRLPRDVLDAEIQRILDLGVTLELNAKVTNILEAMREGGFDAAFLAVGAHIGKRAYIPAGEAAHILDAVTLLRKHGGRGAPAARPARRRLRRRQHGDGRRAHRQAPRRRARRSSSTAARASAMPAHDFEVEEALEEGVMMKWLSTIKHADEGKLVLEKMELDETGFPQPTGETEELDGRLARARARPGSRPVAARRRAGPRDRGRRREGRRAHDDRPRGHLRRRRHGARRAHRHRRRRPRQAGRAQHRCLAARRRVRRIPPSPSSRASSKLNIWYYADAPKTVAPQLDAIRRQSSFDEVTQGLDEANALFEARRCLSCGNCFGCDNCYGVCPDNAVLKVDEGDGYAFDLDYCKGCGICVEECPCGAIEMVPETI